MVMRLLEIHYAAKSAECTQCGEIDDRVALRRRLNFSIATVRPFKRVPHHAGAHHVQIDVDKAAIQVVVTFNRRCVVAVFPEGTLATLAPVVVLRGAPRSQLHTARNHTLARVPHQEMNVVGSHHVVEDAQAETLLRFEEPVEIALPVAREPEQERLLVTAMRQMPDVVRQKISVRSRHDLLLFS